MYTYIPYCTCTYIVRINWVRIVHIVWITKHTKILIFLNFYRKTSLYIWQLHFNQIPKKIFLFYLMYSHCFISCSPYCNFFSHSNRIFANAMMYKWLLFQERKNIFWQCTFYQGVEKNKAIKWPMNSPERVWAQGV